MLWNAKKCFLNATKCYEMLRNASKPKTERKNATTKMLGNATKCYKMLRNATKCYLESSLQFLYIYKINTGVSNFHIKFTSRFHRYIVIFQ